MNRRVKLYIHNKVREEDRCLNEEYNTSYYSNKKYDFWQCSDKYQPKNTDANIFQVIWLKNIRRIVNILYYDYSEYSLIDIGCGSGISTLYFAENYKFKDFYGFDLSSELIDAANTNLSVFKENNNIDVNFFVSEATEAKLPETPKLLFLFNSFGWSTLKLFIDQHLQNLTETKSVLAYANDLHINEISEHYPMVKIVRDNYYNLSLVYF